MGCAQSRVHPAAAAKYAAPQLAADAAADGVHSSQLRLLRDEAAAAAKQTREDKKAADGAEGKIKKELKAVVNAVKAAEKAAAKLAKAEETELRAKATTPPATPERRAAAQKPKQRRCSSPPVSITSRVFDHPGTSTSGQRTPARRAPTATESGKSSPAARTRNVTGGSPRRHSSSRGNQGQRTPTSRRRERDRSVSSGSRDGDYSADYSADYSGQEEERMEEERVRRRPINSLKAALKLRSGERDPLKDAAATLKEGAALDNRIKDGDLAHAHDAVRAYSHAIRLIELAVSSGKCKPDVQTAMEAKVASTKKRIAALSIMKADGTVSATRRRARHRDGDGGGGGSRERQPQARKASRGGGGGRSRERDPRASSESFDESKGSLSKRGADIAKAKQQLPELPTDSELKPEPELEPVHPGTLIVKVVSCSNLIGADNHGTSSDPYVTICLDDRMKQAQRTARCDKTLYPVFNESLNFEKFTKDCRKLTVAVFDYDRGAKDDFIGECVVDVQEMVRKATGGAWVETFAFGDSAEKMSKRERKQLGKRAKSGDEQPCGSVKLNFCYREDSHVDSSAAMAMAAMGHGRLAPSGSRVLGLQDLAGAAVGGGSPERDPQARKVPRGGGDEADLAELQDARALNPPPDVPPERVPVPGETEHGLLSGDEQRRRIQCRREERRRLEDPGARPASTLEPESPTAAAQQLKQQELAALVQPQAKRERISKWVTVSDAAMHATVVRVQTSWRRKMAMDEYQLMRSCAAPVSLAVVVVADVSRSRETSRSKIQARRESRAETTSKGERV